MILAASTFVTGIAEGQVGPGARPKAGAIARYVPTSTQVFISIRRLADVNHALQQTRAWRFGPLLTGNPAGSESSFDLRSVARSFLGPDSKIDVDDLMNCELGLVAPSWSRISQAIWLIGLPDDDILDRWFPREGLRDGDSSRTARVFRTADGMTVCVRDRVVALARPSGDWAQLGTVLRLLAGRGGDVLEKDASYRELTSSLTGQPLAILYSSWDAPASEVDDGGLHSRIAGTNNREHMAIGLYATEDRIELAVRGTRSPSGRRTALADSAVERMLALPQTTLIAIATTVDWTTLTRARGADGKGGTLGRYLGLLAGLRRNDSSPDAREPELGRHVIAAWDQDLGGGGSTPQLALLIESRDARVLVDEAAVVVSSLTNLISAIEQADVRESLPVEWSSHLGVRIGSVPLRDYAKRSKFPWATTLANLKPSWVASESWFIIALTRDHIERILDAQAGFATVLGDMRDAPSIRRSSTQSSTMAMMQGGMAATVMDRWLRDAEGGKPSLINGALWGDRNPSEMFDPGRLGIELLPYDDPGFVEVAGVEPFTPADNRLQAGDRILGVDGRLLELVAPAADLRQWWEQVRPGSRHIVRVIRDGSIIELEVTRREDDVRLTNLLVQPLDALRELAALARTLPFVSLNIRASGRQNLSAEVTLRLARNEP